MCPFAIGSQTLLSTIVPASYCGVVGYKPTFDRLRFDGVTLAPSFDTVGFLTPDVAMLRQVVAPVLPGWRTDQPARRSPVIGIPPRWGPESHADGWAAFERHLQALESAGLELRRGTVPWTGQPEHLDHWAAVIRDLLHGEMAQVHGRWYADRSSGPVPPLPSGEQTCVLVH